VCDGSTKFLGSTKPLTKMSKGKGKGTVHPRTGHEGAEGE